MGWCDGGAAARSCSSPGSLTEAAMQNTTHGFMGGYGLWTVLGVLLAIFLVVAIVRMMQKK